MNAFDARWVGRAHCGVTHHNCRQGSRPGSSHRTLVGLYAGAVGSDSRSAGVVGRGVKSAVPLNEAVQVRIERWIERELRPLRR